MRHLGKFLANFTPSHDADAKQVLRYLLQPEECALHMSGLPGDDVCTCITSFTDSDYADDPDDTKPVSGYVMYLDGNVISFGSRKQGTNA